MKKITDRAVKQGDMTPETWFICPYCKENSTLEPVSDQDFRVLLKIPTKGLNRSFKTKPIRYSCSHCGAEFLIPFSLTQIYLGETLVTQYNLPSKSQIEAQRRREMAQKEIKQTLAKAGIGTSDDQDDTPQGEV
jgi:hypothetical protein